jgi:hypothetical protein
MPLYYFCLENGRSAQADDPEEFPDDAAARKYGETVASELAVGALTSGRYVVVKNADGVEVHRVYLTPSKKAWCFRIVP